MEEAGRPFIGVLEEWVRAAAVDFPSEPLGTCQCFFVRREALLGRVRAWVLQARAEAKKRSAGGGPATQALRAAIVAVPGQRERVTNCNLVQV